MTSPKSLGRYELTAHLARGGMADVYYAVDRMLDRQVAVKILHQRFAGADTFVARFRKEARAAASLSHPNIVSIYDWGEREGAHFIVMELIEGCSLRDVLASEGRLLPRRAAEIGAEVASALEVAHRNRVIHRDIKPGNILLASDGTIKVTDFGVARAWDDSQDLTRDGAVIGTATYFSPEQARGDPADERSDIYSLGIVLYEMLAGRPPFSGETPVSVAYQHVTAEVVPPTRISPDVPLELESVVMRCLGKDPNRRYQTANEVRNDLLLFLQGRTLRGSTPARPAPAQTARPPLPPPTAPPDEMYRRVQAAPRRTSQLPFMITSIALAAGVVFGVYVLLNSFSTAPPTTTVAPTPTIVVPDVVGLPQDQARQALQDAGFRVTPETEPAAAEAGVVIRTDPAAGKSATDTGFVRMVVSSGPAEVQVPTVVGSTQERAVAQLTGQGFEVTVRTARDDTVGAGLVVSQSPPGGASAAGGTPVELVVSAGPRPIQVPRVVGLTQDRAEGRLEGLGLVVETTTETSRSVEAGLVIRQTPAPGADINPGWTVQIVVSEGAEQVELAELAGRPVAEAVAAVEELGLEAAVLQESSSEVAAGLVVRSEPPSGTTLDAGSRVTVVESTGPAMATVPDLAGASVEDAEARLADLGLRLEVAGSRAAVSDEALDGRVARQAPEPGEELLLGETVLAVLGNYTPPTTEAEEPPEDDPGDSG